MTAPDTARAAQVLAAEARRAAALVAADAEALAALLHPDLHYVHATGVQHTRAQLLASLATGPRFLAVHLAEPRLSLHGAVALVHGELRLSLQRSPGAELIEARSLASQVWLQDAASGAWQLRQFQSTRPA